MQPWSRDPVGRLDEHVLESEALRGNRLGDPHQRPLWVYTPPGTGETPLPSIYLIQGHTGQIDMWRNRSAFRPNVVELYDLEADPLEQHNLAGTPSVKAVEEELSAELWRWMRETDDPLLNGPVASPRYRQAMQP